MAGLMRNLGAFFGHVIKGVKAAPTQPQQQPPQPLAPAPAAIRQQIHEQTVTTPTGEQVTLRRIITDEVHVQPPTGQAGPVGPASPS